MSHRQLIHDPDNYHQPTAIGPMKYEYFIFFLLLWSSICCCASEEFLGTYECTGYDPYLKKSYTGVVRISQQDTVYRLEMKYDTGEEALGTGGLFDEDTMAVVFQDNHDLKKVGLERYSYSDDRKSIQGYWVYLGKNKLGKENCTKKENRGQVSP